MALSRLGTLSIQAIPTPFPISTQCNALGSLSIQAIPTPFPISTHGISVIEVFQGSTFLRLEMADSEGGD